MEAERLRGKRPCKALSWCLALVLCAQMLGTSAMQAFADEVVDTAVLASESLGKNLVYDDVYGVKTTGIALMVKRGSVTDGSGNASEGVTQVDTVNSSGTVLASFGLGDVPSSETNKAHCIEVAMASMQQLMTDEFSFSAAPKNVNDKVKYGFVSNDGAEVASARYDKFVKRASAEPLVAAVDLDGSVVDVYDGEGVKRTSVPMPEDWSKGWSEEGPSVSIWFAYDETRSLTLNISGYDANNVRVSKEYVWDSASNSFVAKGDTPSVGETEREWSLPDGGKVTITKVEGQDAYRCVTPKKPEGFIMSGVASLWNFEVFSEAELIQYKSGGTRIWDFTGVQPAEFQGVTIESSMGNGRFLCYQNSTDGQGYFTQYSIRLADGTSVKVLPGTRGYYYRAPFVYTTESNGNCIILDSAGEEVKTISPTTAAGTVSLNSSGLEGALVATETVYDGGYTQKALVAYDKGEWIDSPEKAMEYARAYRTILADGTVVYRIAVYDQEDGTVYPKATPAYYRYVDRDLNELSRSAYTEWITWQQTKRTLGDGTVMTYTANDAGKYGAVDAEGEALIPFEYDAYYDCGDHESLILLKKGDAWEFFDTSTIDTKKEPVPATSVTISGAPEQLAVGATAQLTAAVEPANSTDKVMWATSDDKVLTVDASGKVTAIANGKATVTATAGDRSALVEIAVTTPATSVTISGAPEKPLNVGGTAQLKATVQPESSTDKVEWASSDENVLTVDADGLVTALANGEATITATAGEQTASVAITVVTPAAGLDAEALTLYVGDEPSQLEATVLPATASDKGVAWTSSNSDVAMVDDNGAVTPVGVGTCTVTATTLDGGLTAECAVTVGEHVAGVTLDKSEASIVGVGTTQLVATVSPAGALDKSVAWSTSDKSVATVNENGLVTAVGKGTAVITATSLEDEQQSASCTVTVSNPVTGFDLSAASVALVKGDAQTVNVAAFGALSGAVDDYGLTLSVEGEGSLSNGVWSDASGNAVFSVEAGEGGDYTIAALGTGKGTLVFEAQQGASTVRGVVAVSVTNPAKAIALDVTSKQLTVGDEPFTLTATVDPLDADEAGSIAWSTSNSAVATVDGGKVTPLGVGSATITAKVGDVSATCEVAVAAKEIAATEGDSAYQASVEVTSPAAAEQLDKIAQGNGGSLSLAVQGAQDLTESAQQTITSLQGGQTKVAEILDVSLRNADGGEVAVSLEDGTMTVRVRMTDAMRALDPKTLKVSYVADDGKVQGKDTWVDGDDLCFATEHFSTYVVTGSERQTSGGEIGGGSAGGSGTVLPGGGGSGQDDAVKPLLAPTGDTLALPMALAGCAIAAALVCLAFVRGGRRVK